MWRGHVSCWYSKGGKARLSRTQNLVIYHAFSLFTSFHLILNITQFNIFHTQRTTVIWGLCNGFGHELLGPDFKTSQLRHTQANFVTCYWDQTFPFPTYR